MIWDHDRIIKYFLKILRLLSFYIIFTCCIHQATSKLLKVKCFVFIRHKIEWCNNVTTNIWRLMSSGFYDEHILSEARGTNETCYKHKAS